MWARAVPYAGFARLRQEAPAAWSPGEGPGFWSVTWYGAGTTPQVPVPQPVRHGGGFNPLGPDASRDPGDGETECPETGR
jgi:hypothetical protein